MASESNPILDQLRKKYRVRLCMSEDLIRVLVIDGTLEEVQLAIEQGQPVYPPVGSRIWQNYSSGYHEAAAAGKFELVKLLIRLGTPPDLKSGLDRTAVHEVCTIFNPKLAEAGVAILEFLKDKVTFNQRDVFGYRPMDYLLDRDTRPPFKVGAKLLAALVRLNPEALDGIPTPIDVVIESSLWQKGDLELDSFDQEYIVLLRIFGLTASKYFDFETGKLIESNLVRFAAEKGIRVNPEKNLVERLQSPIPLATIQEVRWKMEFFRSLVCRLIPFLD